MRKARGLSLYLGRKLVCAALAAVLPVWLTADDSAAILRQHGGLLLNGNPAAPSTAIFPNDTVQTRALQEGTIDAAGSSVMVEPETLVQFEGDELVLDHGTLLVSTSRGLRVRVGCITVSPATAATWTQYDVIDVEGKVTVAARKKDVNIDFRGSTFARSAGRSERVTVREGEHKTREEGCGTRRKSPTYVAAQGATLNSPWAIGSAAGAIVLGTCLILCFDDDPVSPSKP